MKQGSGNNSNGGRKVEPHGPNYTPGVASQIGESLGNHATDTARNLHGASAPMYENKKSFMAPEDVSCTHHQSGSQGKHG